MVKAFAHTAEYDTTIATALLEVDVSGTRVTRGGADTYFRPTIELADRFTLSLEKIRDLRYGENPPQAAAWYRLAGGAHAGLGAALILQGKELSYTNLLDLDAAARLAGDFEEPAAVVVK